MFYLNETDVNSTTTMLTAIRPQPPLPEYRTDEYMILIGVPCIVIPGTICNALSVAVFCRQRFRSMSSSVYLIALAFCDTISLYSNSPTKNFIRMLTGFDYSSPSSNWCRIYLYLLKTSICIGAWLIVSVTIERLIIVTIPIKAKLVATRTRACYVACVIITALLCVYTYVLVIHEVSNGGCRVNPYYVANGFDFAQKMIHMVIYSILPSSILFSCNAVIIYKLVKSSSFRAASTSSDAGQGSGGDTSQRLIVMLVTVSTIFLILTLPLTVFFLSMSLNPGHYSVVLYRSLGLMKLSNGAINFLLYCSSGPAFRKELLDMFGCGEPAVVRSQQTVSTVSQSAQG